MKKIYLLLIALAITTIVQSQFILNVDLTYKMHKDSSIVGTARCYEIGVDTIIHSVFFFNNFSFKLELNKNYMIQIATETEFENWYVNTTIPDYLIDYTILYHFRCNLADKNVMSEIKWSDQKQDFQLRSYTRSN